MSASSSERHFKQAAAVVVSGVATIGASLIARRSVRARVYRPKMFEANHIPPKFNLSKDAARAMLDATFLSFGFFAFGIASTSWLMDVTTLEQFNRQMKAYWGAEENEKKVATQIDQQLDDAVTNMFTQKK